MKQTYHHFKINLTIIGLIISGFVIVQSNPDPTAAAAAVETAIDTQAQPTSSPTPAQQQYVLEVMSDFHRVRLDRPDCAYTISRGFIHTLACEGFQTGVSDRTGLIVVTSSPWITVYHPDGRVVTGLIVDGVPGGGAETETETEAVEILIVLNPSPSPSPSPSV